MGVREVCGEVDGGKMGDEREVVLSCGVLDVLNIGVSESESRQDFRV